VLSGALLVKLPLAIADRSNAYEFMDVVIDVRRILVSKFVKEVDDDTLRVGAISGIIEVLDDPYTLYVPPAEEVEFNKELRGHYVGIGAEVNIIDDYLTIVTPMDDSPALQAGVMAGDVVIEIEGESTYQLSIDECIDKLMGEPETKVTVRVRHLDDAEEDLLITRREIVTPTVKGLRRDGAEWDYCINEDLGLGYIRITQFNDETVDELREALLELTETGLGGLVLDLRDNPGGALSAAVRTSDLFLDSGDIVSYQPRHGQSRSWSATADEGFEEFPLIILVNERSASASEIVAGALQENGRAVVLGTRTFGKGSVQEVQPLPYDNGTLKYTTAYYLLPSGRSIQRRTESTVWGVDPDPGMVVPMRDEDYVAMFRARREFEIIRNAQAEDETCGDAEWVRANLVDEPLAIAVEAIEERILNDAWPTGSDEDASLVAFDQELMRATDRRNRLIESLSRTEARIHELQDLSGEAGEQEPILPPDVSLENGRLTITDSQGNPIRAFRIGSGNLELALRAVELEPIE
jgi:carboxyl-terminal processing protease